MKKIKKISGWIAALLLTFIWFPLWIISYPLNIIVRTLKICIDHFTRPEKKLWDYIKLCPYRLW